MNSEWTQTSPGRFQRTRGFMGEMYHMMAPKVGEINRFGPSCTIKFTCKDENTDIEACLQRAWTQMLLQFPTLAAVDEANAIVVEIPNSDTWLSQTFLVHESTTSDEFLAQVVKYRTAVLHYFPVSSELTLDIDHQFIDGRGFAYFWDAFFSTLENLFKGREELTVSAEAIMRRLPRSMEDMMGVPKTETERGKQLAGTILATMAPPEHPIAMPVDASLPPKRFAGRTMAMKEEASAAIFKVVKARNHTVTAAWHAAIILAIQQIQAAKRPPAGNSFTSMSLFDMRRYYPAGFDPRANPIVGCHCALPCTIETDNKSFDEIAALLTGFYKAGFENPLFKDTWKEAFPPMSRVYGETHAGGPPSTTPEVSSIGVVENFMKHSYGAWEIEEFSLFAVLQVPSAAMFIWTWRGRFTLKACYNDAYYEVGDVDELLLMSRDILLKELGI